VSSQPSARFGAVICVGPGEKERERFEDFAESLLFYEPHIAGLAVIDDEVPTRNLLSRLSLHSQCVADVIANPRNRKGSGWGAGLTAAILTGIRWLHCKVTPDFILKADTDTLIIGPFSSRVQNRFAASPNVGMLGSFMTYPDRARDFYTEREIAPAMEKLLRQFTVWRQTYRRIPRLQVGCFGRYRRIRRILQQALLNGYVLGEYCIGGGYAVSGASVDAIVAEGFLDDPLLWLHTPCSEDVVVSLYVRAVRKKLADFNGEGEPFGVKNPGLPFAPELLLDRGYAIIHSVKDHRQFLEDRTRAFFRERRHVSAPSPNYGTAG
jgi:hypothetical protein